MRAFNFLDLYHRQLKKQRCFHYSILVATGATLIISSWVLKLYLIHSIHQASKFSTHQVTPAKKLISHPIKTASILKQLATLIPQHAGLTRLEIDPSHLSLQGVSSSILALIQLKQNVLHANSQVKLCTFAFKKRQFQLYFTNKKSCDSPHAN